MKNTIYEHSDEWSIDSQIFEKSVEAYSSRKPENIPYIKELTSTLNFSEAKKPMRRNQLEHNMELTKELQKDFSDITFELFKEHQEQENAFEILFQNQELYDTAEEW